MRFARNEWNELANKGTLTSALIDSLKVDGYAILESVFDTDKLARWRSEFDPLLAAKVEGTDLTRGLNRFNVKIPLSGAYNDPELLHNPLVMPAVYALLGDDPLCTWLTADTPLHGAEYQAAHADDRQLFPGIDVALPAYAIVINVPLVDCRPDNGPMDFWPGGTHMMAGVDPVTGTATREPVSGLMPAGSIFIRDTRMWHRGTPNASGEPRPLLSLVMSRFWFDFGELIADGERFVIDADTWDTFSPELRSLFRLADVPGTRGAEARKESAMRHSRVARDVAYNSGS